MRKTLLGIVTAGALGVAGLAAVVPAIAGDGPLPPELQPVRAAVAKYHSFEQAEQDGYTVAGEPCVASPGGTMGFHAINPALLMNDAIDASRPEILLYVPKGNGQLKLVGVEYWKVDADQNLDDLGRPAVALRARLRRPDAGSQPDDAGPLRLARLGRRGEPEWRLRTLQPRTLVLATMQGEEERP